MAAPFQPHSPLVESPSSPSALADRAAHAFTAQSMVQGLACFGKGVELVVTTNERLLARVRSKRTHEVSLRVAKDRLVIACSCPGHSLGLTGCKHAWAALLEADRRSVLGAMRESRGKLQVDMVPVDVERPTKAKKTEAAQPAARTAREARARSDIAAMSSSERRSAGKAKTAATKPAKSIRAAPST